MTTFDEADDTVKREHLIFQMQRDRAQKERDACRERLRDCCGEDHAHEMVGGVFIALVMLAIGLICGWFVGEHHGERKTLEALEGRR